MSDLQIVLPSDFRAPRYMDGLWMDSRRRWSGEDIDLLIAACDMRLRPMMAANSLGRAPTNLVHKALELGIFVPKDWRDLIHHKKKKSDPLLNLQYPFIVKPDDKHADLIAVNRLVSRQMPGREDVCQDIMLALWEAKTSLEELKKDPKALRSFVKAFRKTSYERGGYAESMDVTLHSQDGDGQSKYENIHYQRTLVNEDDKFIEGIEFGRGYERNFADDLLDEIDDEERETGVPAALWMRAELR